MAEKKTLGTAIDEIIGALKGLESDARATAVSAACADLGIPASALALSGSAGSGSAAPSAQTPAGNTNSTPRNVADIRTVREEKAPRTAKDMACIVAYYLQDLAPDTERKSTVTVADIEKYFKQANFKLPKRIEQILVNAKDSGYFDSAGRGSYRLNAVGYNLAAHTLPRTKSGA